MLRGKRAFNVQCINRLIFPYICQSQVVLYTPPCMQQCTNTIQMFKTFDRRGRGEDPFLMGAIWKGETRDFKALSTDLFLYYNYIYIKTSPVFFFKTMSKTTRISNLSAHWIFTCTDILRRDVFVDNMTSDLQLWLIQNNALLELDIYQWEIKEEEQKKREQILLFTYM